MDEGLALLAQDLALWNEGIALLIPDFCLHQYVIRNSVIPVMISRRKIIGITPALPKLTYNTNLPKSGDKALLCQYNTWLWRRRCSPLPSLWADDHTGPGSQIWLLLSITRADVKAAGEHL